MLIHEMSQEECRKALSETSFGRLACARDNQPYVVPVYFVFDGEHQYGHGAQHLYLFSSFGRKIEWMRANPLVCVEIDEVKGHDDWVSVVVFGRYEELPDTPECRCARARAHELLQKRAMWWQPAFVAVAHHEPPSDFTPVFYRIRVERLTGHRATPDPR